MFAASPCASDSKPFSSASMASPRSIIETTSASEIQSGASKDIFKKEIAAALIWNGVGVAAEADRSHRLMLGRPCWKKMGSTNHAKPHEMDAFIRVTSCDFVDRFTASICSLLFQQPLGQR